jgi:pyridoxamine 5'-phosphate oxidase
MTDLDHRPAAATLSGDETIELPEFDAPPADPVALLRRWLAAAEERGVREPRTFVLATADRAGHASSRVLLLKDVEGGTLVFTSHTDSRKGRDIAETGWASMSFHWRETLQQISVSGPVCMLPDERSDALFAERPVAAQATTVVCDQGADLLDEDALHARADELISLGRPLARPRGWAGYALTPHRIEFWHGRASRLHRRLEYRREDSGSGWTTRRLQP